MIENQCGIDGEYSLCVDNLPLWDNIGIYPNHVITANIRMYVDECVNSNTNDYGYINFTCVDTAPLTSEYNCIGNNISSIEVSEFVLFPFELNDKSLVYNSKPAFISNIRIYLPNSFCNPDYVFNVYILYDDSMDEIVNSTYQTYGEYSYNNNDSNVLIYQSITNVCNVDYLNFSFNEIQSISNKSYLYYNQMYAILLDIDCNNCDDNNNILDMDILYCNSKNTNNTIINRKECIYGSKYYSQNAISIQSTSKNILYDISFSYPNINPPNTIQYNPLYTWIRIIYTDNIMSSYNIQYRLQMLKSMFSDALVSTINTFIYNEINSNPSFKAILQEYFPKTELSNKKTYQSSLYDLKITMVSNIPMTNDFSITDSPVLTWNINCNNNIHCYKLISLVSIDSTYINFHETFQSILSNQQSTFKSLLLSMMTDDPSINILDISIPTSNDLSSTNSSNKSSKLDLPLLITYILYGICGFIVIFGIVGRLHSDCIGGDNIRISGCIYFAFWTLDFYSDIIFSIEMISFGINNRNIFAVWILVICCYLFIILSWSLNMKNLIQYEEIWSQNEIIGESVHIWLIDWSVWLNGLTAFSGSSFGSLELCNTNFFGYDPFCMGLNERHIKTFNTHRLLIQVILDDTPQLIIQIIYFYFIVDQKISSVLVLTFIASLCSIIIGFVDVISSKRILKLAKRNKIIQDILTIKFSLISPEIVKNSNRLSITTYAIRDGIGKVFGLNPRSVEIHFPIAIKDGINIAFTIRTNKKSIQQLKHEFNKYIHYKRGKILTEMFVEKWKLTEIPRIKDAKTFVRENDDQINIKVSHKPSNTTDNNNTESKLNNQVTYNENLEITNDWNFVPSTSPTQSRTKNDNNIITPKRNIKRIAKGVKNKGRDLSHLGIKSIEFTSEQSATATNTFTGNDEYLMKPLPAQPSMLNNIQPIIESDTDISNFSEQNIQYKPAPFKPLPKKPEIS